MDAIPVYDLLRGKMAGLARRHGLQEEEVLVYTEVLTPEQAIGRPERRDFPLLKGKEKMVEACLREARGQAYTGRPGFFRGSLAGVLELDLRDEFERAVFIATLNALARHAGLVHNTLHCRDLGPGDCGRRVADFLS
ncbi:MAG TPA: hypothetical protein GXX25_04785, partial [Desulfotomaculum sp.]|nr:hypothetical protein [Desulfotomaculum sp.]